MRINAYLNFNGQCEAAFKFYEQTLHGKIEMMMTHRDSPIAKMVSPEMQDKILHVHLVVGDQHILGSDAPPEYFSKPQGFSVSISVAEPSEAERIFKAFAEGGTVQMPLQETFWSPKFGMATDRFGTPWIINTEPKS